VTARPALALMARLSEALDTCMEVAIARGQCAEPGRAEALEMWITGVIAREADAWTERRQQQRQTA